MSSRQSALVSVYNTATKYARSLHCHCFSLWYAQAEPHLGKPIAEMNACRVNSVLFPSHTVALPRSIALFRRLAPFSASLILICAAYRDEANSNEPVDLRVLIGFIPYVI